MQRTQRTNSIIISTQNSAAFPPSTSTSYVEGAVPPRTPRTTVENKEKPIPHITHLFFFFFFTSNHRTTIKSLFTRGRECVDVKESCGCSDGGVASAEKEREGEEAEIDWQIPYTSGFYLLPLSLYNHTLPIPNRM